MSNLQERLLAKMPEKLFKFLDTLSEPELAELQKLNPQLLAKVYQAGAIFAIDAGLELAEEDKKGEK